MYDGIPLESSYPYGSGYSTYSGICSASNKKKAAKVLNRIGHYTSVTNSQLKAILAHHGPVSVAMYSNFLFH